MYANAAYIQANLDNMNKATGAVYVLTAMAVSIGSHVDFASNKNDIERFFMDFATIVSESEHD